MKLTNLQIINCEQVLVKLKQQELPILTAYKLNKTIKAIGEKLKFIHEQREELIKKYGKEIDGQFGIDQNDQENFNKFLEDFKVILEVEEEVNFEKMELQHFIDSGVKLSSDEFELVSFLFVE